MPGSAPESPCRHLAARAQGAAANTSLEHVHSLVLIFFVLFFLTLYKFRVTANQKLIAGLSGMDDNITEHVPVSVKVPVHM